MCSSDLEHLPVNELGLSTVFASESLTEQQKIAKVESDVLRQIGGRTQHGMTVLMEISGQVFYYDRNGEWLISAMATFQEAPKRRRVTGKQSEHQASIQTRVALHKDLSKGDPLGALQGVHFCLTLLSST